jgi:large subunit ribosomal protein L10
MAKVELKQPIVDEISAKVKDAQSVVLVDYRGLTVEQDTELLQECWLSLQRKQSSWKSRPVW